ncbi:CBS domain-containing protein [Planotetraspora mira]|jgi:CBS-domain-containing membrane protein|nr:CBS domain-containing protein [Planotetraspora mira]
MTVRDVMSRFVIAVETGASFSDVVNAVCRFNVDAVPVVDQDKCVLGVISDDDLLLKGLGGGRTGDSIFEGAARRRERRKAMGRTAAEIMTSPAVTVTEDTALRHAAHLMHDNRIRQLPVVDARTGSILGLVRQADLLKVFSRSPEDIRDEVIAMVGPYIRSCTVQVEDGVVSLVGSVDRRSRIAILLDAVWQVDGVVDVEAEVSYAEDDLGRTVPPLYI